MSAQDIEPEIAGVQPDEEDLAEQLGIHPDYEPVVLEPVSGYGPLVDAWVRMLYPLNVSERYDGHGIIECGNWRHAQQFPDGRGVYRSGPSGGQTIAIRTADRTVVWNNYHGSPWPYNCEAQDAVDAEFEVPYQFIGELLTRQTDMVLHNGDTILARGRDEDSWVDGDLWMQGVVRADVMEGEDAGVLLEHTDGSQVYVGLDETAHDHPMFGFAPFDGKEGIKVPSARDALDLLRPDEALSTEKRQGEWFFVDAEETHDEAKGLIQNPGVGEKDWAYHNPAFPDLDVFPSRHEAIGAITKEVRDRGLQMDWLAGVEPTKTYLCGSPLESHLPRDWKTRCHNMEFIRRVVKELVKGEADLHRDSRDRASELSGLEYDVFEEIGVFWQDSPQDVFDKIERGIIDLSHERARELTGGVFVRGTVRHRDAEHTVINVDGWHQPATHGREVLVLEPEQMNVHVDV